MVATKKLWLAAAAVLAVGVAQSHAEVQYADATTKTSSSSTTDTDAGGSTSSSGTSTTTTSSSSVTCKFRYALATASNVHSVATTTSSSSTSSDSSTDGDSTTAGSSEGTVSAGSATGSSTTSTVTVSSAGSSESADSSSSSSSSSSTTPSTTTKTPSTTTKTPSTTTATPTTTTKTPTTTTKTTTSSDSSSTADSSASTGDTGSSERRYLKTSSAAGSGTSATVTTESSGSSTTNSTSKTSTTTSTTSKTSTTTESSTATDSSVETSSSSSSDTSSSSSTSGEFSCDSTFYGAWAKMGLTCGESSLSVTKAVANAQCLIYSGEVSSAALSDAEMCMSVCRFPKCSNGTWDYTADDGISSEIYADLDLLTLLNYAGASDATSSAVSEPFSNMTFTVEKECDYESDASFTSCQCSNLLAAESSSSSTDSTTSGSSTYTVPVDKGLEDSDHWADGVAKTTVDKVSVAASTIGGTAATVSVVAGGAMTVVGGIMGTSSGAVASGVSAGASVGVTIAAVDLCQFSIMINQMRLDARPRLLENMGKNMAPAGFSFLPFGKTSSTSSSRRLTTSSSSGSSSSGSGSSDSSSTEGMERYAEIIGVQVDMMFYLTVAGIAVLIGALFGAYALAMVISKPFVKDFGAFSRKWFDKAVGLLMMLLILSEYAIGCTAAFQICYCVDNDSIDASFFLAIFSLIFFALGTIMYGIIVINKHTEELRDIGTKDHYEKPIHAKYGPLYDEYKFEGRFFFAPKLLLALLCGMTTGATWISGMYQLIVMIVLNVAFLFYLEVKQPYPTQFVQRTTSFVMIIKVSVLFLSFFLISSASAFQADIPTDLRKGIAFAIVGLQVLVLIALMVRQVYIFYRTWKLKKSTPTTEPDHVHLEPYNPAASGRPQNVFALGETDMHRGTNTAMLGDDNTPVATVHYEHTTPEAYNKHAYVGDNMAYGQQQQQYQQQQYQQQQYQQQSSMGYEQQQQQPGRLQQLQPNRRTQTVVVHEGPGGYRSNEIDL